MSVTLNYTTSIEVTRTVGEVQQLLGEHGAAAVGIRYGQDRQPAGVSFTLRGPHGERAFTLPVDVDAVHRLLNSREAADEFRRLKRTSPTMRSREQAARVAWRTAQDWLEAQLALVQAGMATLDQAMLPYLHVDGEITLYERYREHEQRAITEATE